MMIETIFNELKNKELSIPERIQRLPAIMNLIITRTSDGHCNPKVQIHLESIIKAICEYVESDNSDDAILDSYIEILESEFKKYYFIIKIIGGQVLHNSLVDYLSKSNYQLWSSDFEKELDKYIVIINCNDEMMSDINCINLCNYYSMTYYTNTDFQTNLKNYDNSKNTNIETIITGMSYTYYGIDTKYFSNNTALLATPSQDIYYDIHMLRKCYADNSMSLKYSIFGLAPYSLHYDLSLSRLVGMRTLQYYQEFGSIHNAKTDLHQIIDFEHSKMMKYFGYNIGKEIYDKYLYTPMAIHEYNQMKKGDFNPSNISDKDIYEINSKYHKKYPETVEENKQLIREYLAFCQECNIHAIFMMPPFSNWYKQNMNQAHLTELWSFIDSLKDEFSYSIFDFTDEIWEDYYFVDYAHLNELGAIKLSSRLNALIEQFEAL